MNTLLTALGILLVINFQFSASLPVIYSKITDCSDGKYINFQASLTPNPVIWVGSPGNLAPTLWLSLTMSITDDAKILLSNKSYHEFDKKLQIRFTFEGPSWEPFEGLEEILHKFKLHPVCGKTMPHVLCRKIHESLMSSLYSFQLFSSIELGLSKTGVSDGILNFIVHMKQIEVVFQLHATVFGQEIVCIQFEFESAKNFIVNEDDSVNRILNAERSFDTPKVEYVLNGTKSISCPENSKEISDGSCECNYPLSGPLCSFQCRFNEMNLSKCHLPKNTSKDCLFSNKEYVESCINDTNILIFNGSVIIEVKSLHNITIKWRLVNFVTEYRYEITLYDSSGSLGRVFKDDFNFAGLETIYNLRSLCLNELVRGIDCRDNLYEEPCFECPDLLLFPFHDYSIDLKIGVGPRKLAMEGHVMKTINFTTPEVDATAPKITSAALSDNKKVVHVEWMIIDKCPGYIRHYELIVSCDSDKANSSGTMVHDCRTNNQGPMLNGTVPADCNTEDIIVKLRIGTTLKLSDESETFLIKNYSMPPAIIVGIFLGAVLLLSAVGSVTFTLYYKRRVKPLQGWNKVIQDITRRRNRDFRQSLRLSNPPNIPKPDTPKNQATPGEMETPSQHESRNEGVSQSHLDAELYTAANFDDV